MFHPDIVSRGGQTRVLEMLRRGGINYQVVRQNKVKIQGGALRIQGGANAPLCPPLNETLHYDRKNNVYGHKLDSSEILILTVEIVHVSLQICKNEPAFALISTAYTKRVISSTLNLTLGQITGIPVYIFNQISICTLIWLVTGPR